MIELDNKGGRYACWPKVRLLEGLVNHRGDKQIFKAVRLPSCEDLLFHCLSLGALTSILVAGNSVSIVTCNNSYRQMKTRHHAQFYSKRNHRLQN